MKKFFLIMASALVLGGASASAQNLGSILGTVASAASSSSSSDNGSNILGALSKVVYAYTGKTDAVDLPGNWTYTGPAIELGSSNALSNIAGAAVSSTAESKVETYLEQVGLTSGAMTFTFNDDLTFTCTMKGVPLGGTWKTDENANKVTLQFGKTMKYMSMTGTLETTTGGCEMLFDSKRFLSFLKTALSVVAKQSSAASTVSSLAGNYNDMKLGVKLAKTK